MPLLAPGTAAQWPAAGQLAAMREGSSLTTPPDHAATRAPAARLPTSIHPTYISPPTHQGIIQGGPPTHLQ